MLRYCLPDGRSWKRLWEGSFTMLLVLLEHRARKMSRMDGRGAPMIFAAVFTVRWRVLRSAALQFPYQTVMQLVSTLSMVPLYNVVRMGGGRLALFSRRRKCRCCCAFLESDMVLVVQVRFSVMCTPRNLVLLTLSTVELSMVKLWQNCLQICGVEVTGYDEKAVRVICLLFTDGAIQFTKRVLSVCTWWNVNCDNNNGRELPRQIERLTLHKHKLHQR